MSDDVMYYLDLGQPGPKEIFGAEFDAIWSELEYLAGKVERCNCE